MDHDSCSERDDELIDARRWVRDFLLFAFAPGLVAALIFLLSAWFTGELEFGIGCAAFFYLLCQTLVISFGPLQDSGWQSPLAVFSFAAFIVVSAIAGGCDAVGAVWAYASVAAALSVVFVLACRSAYPRDCPSVAFLLPTLTIICALQLVLLLLADIGTAVALAGYLVFLGFMGWATLWRAVAGPKR